MNEKFRGKGIVKNYLTGKSDLMFWLKMKKPLLSTSHTVFGSAVIEWINNSVAGCFTVIYLTLINPVFIHNSPFN